MFLLSCVILFIGVSLYDVTSCLAAGPMFLPGISVPGPSGLRVSISGPIVRWGVSDQGRLPDRDPLDKDPLDRDLQMSYKYLMNVKEILMTKTKKVCISNYL